MLDYMILSLTFNPIMLVGGLITILLCLTVSREKA